MGATTPTIRRRARELRNNMSHVEWVVWRELRGGAQGLRWRRQHPLGPYILDFCCLERRVDLEIDGPEHREPERATADVRRDAALQRRGFKVLRVSNAAVEHDIHAVIDWVIERTRAQPSF